MGRFQRMMFLHSAYFPVSCDYVKESSCLKMADKLNSSENSVSNSDIKRISLSTEPACLTSEAMAGLWSSSVKGEKILNFIFSI